MIKEKTIDCIDILLDNDFIMDLLGNAEEESPELDGIRNGRMGNTDNNHMKYIASKIKGKIISIDMFDAEDEDTTTTSGVVQDYSKMYMIEYDDDIQSSYVENLVIVEQQFVMNAI